MACPFAGNRSNCPANRRRVCNGAIRCGNNTAAARAAALAETARIQQQTAEAQAGGAQVCNQSIGAQLYGASATSLGQVQTTCCDPRRGCCTYPIARRSAYWPTFAHPRWLSCNQLYNRRGR